LEFLLLAQARAVLRQPSAHLAGARAGRRLAAPHRALLGEAPRALQVQKDALTPAEPALRICNSRHRLPLHRASPGSHPQRAEAALARPGPDRRALHRELVSSLAARSYTRLRLRGRQPLWGMGVTSSMALI